MPYTSTSGLPKAVRDNLPIHAQEIYVKVYNSAYQEYKKPSKRRGTSSRSATASKVAWAAVKKTYMKDSTTGKWKQKG